MDLGAYLETAISAAQLAGEHITELRRQSAAEPKGNSDSADLVTATDRLCENVIAQELKERHPDVGIIGEESAGSDYAFTGEPTWVVDPLDGTTNFVHGYPFVCVCIGLVVNREPIVGVVYNPILREMYTAVKGRGAFLNGGKLVMPQAPPTLRETFISTNIGAARDQEFISKNLAVLRELLTRKARAVRMCGSAAQSICHVASGKADCYLEDGYGGPWDVAAAAVILSEAGGCCRGINGEPFELRPGKGAIVCGRTETVELVCAALSAAHRGGCDGSCGNGVAANGGRAGEKLSGCGRACGGGRKGIQRGLRDFSLFVALGFFACVVVEKVLGGGKGKHPGS